MWISPLDYPPQLCYTEAKGGMAYAALLAAKQSGEISYMEFLWKYQHYFPVRTMQLAIHAGVRATLSRQRSRRFRIIRNCHAGVQRAIDCLRSRGCVQRADLAYGNGAHFSPDKRRTFPYQQVLAWQNDESHFAQADD